MTGCPRHVPNGILRIATSTPIIRHVGGFFEYQILYYPVVDNIQKEWVNMSGNRQSHQLLLKFS